MCWRSTEAEKRCNEQTKMMSRPGRGMREAGEGRGR
jgi:hypothetical protein